jgi:tRNA A-37 threonylcarbamoyl transferase component Bud32
LEDLHKLGLSHGDVKPENCMLYNGRVVWIDYDLGIRRDVAEPAIDLRQFEANFPEEEPYAEGLEQPWNDCEVPLYVKNKSQRHTIDF